MTTDERTPPKTMKDQPAGLLARCAGCIGGSISSRRVEVVGKIWTAI